MPVTCSSSSGSASRNPGHRRRKAASKHRWRERNTDDKEAASTRSNDNIAGCRRHRVPPCREERHQCAARRATNND
ncbi:hypothetical protein MTO96_004402 [Rhipicephalus appendiculatus]